METRANYILIGAFALAGFLGMLAFFMWFARIEFDRQFAYYDIDFESVSGLSDASNVRFAGLSVGQVVHVGLSPRNDGRVRVRIEIDAQTPVRTDSIATIESQGVTGVSFVGISAGSPDAPLLADVSDDPVPMIEAGQSVLQTLSQQAPEILEETLGVVRDLRQLIGGENQVRVQTILENIEQSSAAFAQALDDFSAVSGTVSGFVSEIDQFNATLDSLTSQASGVFEAVETTLASVDALAGDAARVLAQGGETLEQMRGPIAAADSYLTEDLAPATRQFNGAIADFEARVAALSDDAQNLMATFGQTGEVATARLEEAEQTLAATDALIARIEETLASVDGAAQRFDGLIADGAGPLIEELRTATSEATAAIRSIGAAAETDLPAIVSDIRAATDTASRVIEQVGSDLSSASGRVDGLASSAQETLEGARVTFANANETLSAINAALETGDRALLAAERAFESADRVVNDDIAAITDRLRETLAQLDGAVAAVAEEIPGVTEDLRAASRSAEQAFAGIEATVDASAPALRAFAATALPQYGRLAVETRTLIGNLDALVEQIRRDPGRFFLNSRAPEYRR